MCGVIIFRLGRNPQFGFPWKDWSNFELGFKYIRVGLDFIIIILFYYLLLLLLLLFIMPLD